MKTLTELASVLLFSAALLLPSAAFSQVDPGVRGGPVNGQPGATPNGGVEDLFTVSGRADAGSRNIQQPNFQQAQQTNNFVFRIPTPSFGVGLVENIDDSTLIADTNRLQALSASSSGGFCRRRHAIASTVT